MATVYITDGSGRYDDWGEQLVMTADIAAVADGDTFTPPGFLLIRNVICNPDDAVVVVANISGTTITFKVASGTPALRVTVIGQ